ncbi:MAG: efflux RND transporter periplasmic adaptor subunit [SAR324 cluster bacterium]|nr:efflux RND transporter periplasmic adaptor subunit [SAR324 cluster bacterium]
MRWFRMSLKVLLPLLVLGASVRAGVWLMDNKPQEKRFSPPPPKLTVEASRLKAQDYHINIRSYGIVRPRTESTLIPQVSGEIISVSQKFQEGGFFEKGDVLLEIDPRDYQAAVKIAQANLEQVRLTASKTTVLAEETRLGQAKLHLERTKIKAPFAGRILTKTVDVGQYVSPGTQLAKIYAIDYAEIRLPLNNQQLEFVDIPEQYRNDTRPQEGPNVILQAKIGREAYQWKGKIVRTEGTIDRTSRQLFLIAQVDDPYSRRNEGTPPLKIGQFVEAEIEGKLLNNTMVIPHGSLYQGNEVVLVEDGILQRKPVSVLWSDSEQVVISDGLKEGDVLVSSSVGSLSSGVPVSAIIDGEMQQGGGRGFQKGQGKRNWQGGRKDNPEQAEKEIPERVKKAGINSKKPEEAVGN